MVSICWRLQDCLVQHEGTRETQRRTEMKLFQYGVETEMELNNH